VSAGDDAGRGGAAGERGLGLIEALVALGIGTLIAFAGLAACTAVARALDATRSGAAGALAVEAQLTQLRNDAASALAVFVPAVAGDGRPNAGREIDFYAKTAGGAEIRWRYLYDAAAQTLTRSDYDASGLAGIRDPSSGVVDPAAHYPALRHVTAFNARALPAAQLGDLAANAYGGLGALFAHAPASVSVAFGAAGPGAAPAIGGNGVVEVRLADAAASRLTHLAAGALASGFTVTGVPVWHAIVYRVDQTHRSWFGVAGKSHVFINARVDVSYDGWKTQAAWCDYNIYGNPDGLDGHDPHADYKPDEPEEQSARILARCVQQNPTPPPAGAPGNAPDPGAVHPALPIDTPPPCWTQPGPGGRCWPDGAPPNWVPPALSAGETPPPAWCAAHAASPVCTTRSAGN
jgi:hypothetical protein